MANKKMYYTAAELEYQKFKAESDKKIALNDEREARRLMVAADRKHAQALEDAKETYEQAIRKAKKMYERAVEKADDAQKKSLSSAQKKLLTAKTKLRKAVLDLSTIEAKLNPPTTGDLSNLHNLQEVSNKQREAAKEIISQEDGDQKEIPAAVESEQEEESAQTAQGSDEESLDFLDAESETDDPDQNAPAKFDFRLPNPDNIIEGGDEFFDHLLDVAKKQGDKDKLTDYL